MRVLKAELSGKTAALEACSRSASSRAGQVLLCITPQPDQGNC